MASETPVLIGFFGESVPDGDQTAAEELSKFGGNPVRLKPASWCVTYWTAPQLGTIMDIASFRHLKGCAKQFACRSGLMARFQTVFPSIARYVEWCLTLFAKCKSCSAH